jgi:hypothetical protein
VSGLIVLAVVACYLGAGVGISRWHAPLALDKQRRAKPNKGDEWHRSEAQIVLGFVVFLWPIMLPWLAAGHRLERIDPRLIEERARELEGEIARLESENKRLERELSEGL